MVCHPLYEVSLADAPLPAHSESRQPFDACHHLRLHLQQLGDLFESQSLFIHVRRTGCASCVEEISISDEGNNAGAAENSRI
jgi:hypothetical protein